MKDKLLISSILFMHVKKINLYRFIRIFKEIKNNNLKL